MVPANCPAKSPPLFDLGIEEHHIERQRVKVYGAARTEPNTREDAGSPAFWETLIGAVAGARKRAAASKTATFYRTLEILRPRNAWQIGWLRGLVRD